MKKPLLIALLLLLGGGAVYAQQTFSASVFNNAIALPGGGFKAPMHPGFDVGWQWTLKDKKKWSLYAWPKVGYYYQRLVHEGVQAYCDMGFRFKITPDIGADAMLGAGYLHTFELHDIFRADANGNYTQTGKAGKPHFQGSLAINLNGAIPQWHIRPFLEYRFKIITPFVNEYVPLLPSVSVHMGTFVTLQPRQSNRKR